MSKLRLFVSANVALFFICRPAFASPDKRVPDAPQEQQSVDPSQPPAENLSVTTPPTLAAPPPPLPAYYYSYQQQLTFRGGVNGVFPQDKFENQVIGFQYLFPKFLSPKLEAGADLQNGGNGHIYAGARWIYWERSYFRPSLKAGLDHLVTSSEGLATFTHYQNYYLRGSAAIEYVVIDPYSLRLEIELLAGTQNRISEITLGVSRGW